MLRLTVGLTLLLSDRTAVWRWMDRGQYGMSYEQISVIENRQEHAANCVTINHDDDEQSGVRVPS